PRSSGRWGSSSWSWIFFGKPCGKSRGSAGRATVVARRHLRAHRSADVARAARRVAGGAAVCARRGEPRRLLSSLAGFGAAAGGGRPAGRHPAGRAGASALWLPAGGGAAAARGLGGERQAGATADARGQPAVPAPTALRAGDDGLAARLARGAQSGARHDADRPRSAVGVVECTPCSATKETGTG